MSGATACSTCPIGTTSDWIFNAGCDPFTDTVPCANSNGPLGVTSCHAPPREVGYTAPNGALVLPPQYLPGGPPYVPNVVPPYYDDTGQPMLQQSY